MKTLGRIIFLTEHGSFVGKRGNTLSVRKNNGEVHEVPLGTVEALVVNANCSISSSLLSELPQFNICCLFLDWSGRVQAKIDGRKGKNIFLRKHQLMACLDPSFSLDMAKHIVISKLRSQEAIFPALNFSRYISEIQNCEAYQKLLGYEGIASKEYFGFFREEFRERKFTFYKRSFHPSLDPANVLLSIAYSLLAVEVSVISDLFDFDEGWGFLHRDYYGRQSLLCDLIEPFRAPIADQYVLFIIDKLALKEDDFGLVDGRLTICDDEKRKTIFKAFKKEFFTDGMQRDLIDWVRSIYNKLISKAIAISQGAA